MTRPHVLCVFGTRPDAIKMAPVVLELKRRETFDVTVAVTGQHREMLDQVLGVFGIAPDFDLNIMTHGQTLAQVTARVLDGLDPILAARPPDWVLAQGDTTTTFAAALSAFYHRAKFGHVEAGLRTVPRRDEPPADHPFKYPALRTDPGGCGQLGARQCAARVHPAHRQHGD